MRYPWRPKGNEYLRQEEARRSSPPGAPGPASDDGGRQPGGGRLHKSRPSFRGALNEIRTKSHQTVIQGYVDEIAKWEKPYHVAWVGDRLTITPPPRPGPAALNRWDFGSERSWSFSPGEAERAMSWGSKPSQVIRYVVDSVEIAHDTWTSGHGVTDRLNIRGPEYSSTTVVALEHNRQFFNSQIPPGKDIRWSVSPTLAGSAADRGLPAGVGEAYDSDVIVTVAPTILALSRLVTDATRCPLAIVVGSCRAPDYSD
jgi:hypothetical protein